MPITQELGGPHFFFFFTILIIIIIVIIFTMDKKRGRWLY